MIRNLFRKVHTWMEYSMMSPEQRSEHAFLSQAVDLADLEWRQKSLYNNKRQRMMPYY